MNLGITQAVLSTSHHPLRVCDSADFDSSSDYMTRGAGLTAAADSKSGIFSTWLRLDGDNGVLLTLLEGDTTLAGAVSRIRVFRTTANIFIVEGMNAAGTIILDLRTVGTYTDLSGWLHVLMSWDLGTAGASNVYISDVSDKSISTFTDDTIDYTLADWSIGADADSTNKIDGCLADFYFAPGQYLDFAQIPNRRKFISQSGKPVHLGVTGALPTGTAPLIYQHLDDGETVANFATNRGTGGDFSIAGTLGAGSTSPSD